MVKHLFRKKLYHDKFSVKIFAIGCHRTNCFHKGEGRIRIAEKPQLSVSDFSLFYPKGSFLNFLKVDKLIILENSTLFFLQ